SQMLLWTAAPQMTQINEVVGVCAYYVLHCFFNDTATTEIYTLSLHDALPILTGTMPARISRLSESPQRKVSRTTCAVPSVGCPANGISNDGVKMRTRAVAAVDGRMNVVSERLNCSASDCIVVSSKFEPSSNTASGLPLKTSSRANTFRILNR